jgi:hypothetical protein
LEKKKLRLIEPDEFPAVIETAQIVDAQKLKYAFTAKIHTISGKRILTVTFFALDTKTATFRVFFDRKTFITERLTPERKWATATLDWLISYWHGDNASVCANEQSARRVRSFFHAEPDITPFSAMQDFQRELRKRQLENKHKRETEIIDNRMKEIKKLPADFEKWVGDVVLDFSRYIYYRRKSKRLILGHCTTCRQDVQFQITKDEQQEHVRHNGHGQCPNCHKNVIFKATGRTAQHADTATAALMQKTQTGFAIRSFKVTKIYSDHYSEPELHICELVRDFYEGRDIVSYEYAEFRQTGKIRWRNSKNEFRLDYACLYFRNVRKVLANTEFRYCGLQELAKNVDCFDVYGYLNAYVHNPAYEYLVKLRLYRLTAENSRGGANRALLNFKGKSYREVLGVDKDSLRQLQRLNAGVEQYRLVKSAYIAGATMTDEQVTELQQMGISGADIEPLLRVTTAGKIIRYVTQCLDMWEAAESRWSYRTRQADIAGFWTDYLNNCVLLGYDLKSDFVLFPRDLKTAHNEVMSRVKSNKAELMNNAIATLFESLQNRYNFVRKDLCVRVPKSADEIVAEGHILRHCVGVGSYIEDMAKGKLLILFVRRMENLDEPFFTLEVKDGLIIQCRGNGNMGMTEEVKKFADEFAKKKLKS